MDLLLHNPWAFTIVGFAIGAAMGSFLNVCAYRIPLGKSIVFPSSSCPQCDSKITWRNNVPIFSWLFLKGRAECCGFSIPVRYFLVELLVALGWAWLFFHFYHTRDLAMFLTGCTFFWLLLGVIVVDAETMLIPDRFSIGGAFAGLVLALVFPSIHGFATNPLPVERIESLTISITGLLIGSSFIYWVGALAEAILKKEALGQGDVKLMGCIGAFCGWEAAIFIVFFGALIGTFFVLFQTIIKWRRTILKDCGENSLGFGSQIPFGPYLASASIGYFFVFRSFFDAFLDKTFAF